MLYSVNFNFNWSILNLVLIGVKLENLSVDGKFKHLKETLLNIFPNYISNKKLNVIIVNLLGLMIT